LIPSFNASGVLPPFTGPTPVDRAVTSPFNATMTEVVQRFGTTEPRIEILQGLLNYRKELRSIGVISGFQWLDGSFIEDVEKVRGIPPKDIDLVTFGPRPVVDYSSFMNLMDLRKDLFDPREAKKAYRADAYFMDTLKPAHILVPDAAYFFGLFSHQRNTALWKGMLVVNLASDDDEAGKLLNKGIA